MDGSIMEKEPDTQQPRSSARALAEEGKSGEASRRRLGEKIRRLG